MNAGFPADRSMRLGQAGVSREQFELDYDSLLGVSDGAIIATLTAFAGVLLA